MSHKSILVVLYNKKVFESETLKSFAKIKNESDKFTVTVWNNGPACLSCDEMAWINDMFLNYKIIETIENIALSTLYNEFINKNKSDYYAFFDDDSTLNVEFLNKFISFEGNGIAVPKVYHGEYICSPLLKGRYNSGPFKHNDKLVAIGSGILLSKEIVDSVRDTYGDVFDGRFGFYGVDYSFFLRVQGINKINMVTIIGDIQHSLSTYLNEDVSKLIFRKKERSIDYALQLKHYNKNKFLSVAKEVVKFVLGKGAYDPLIVISYYLKGRHYKC